MKFKELIKNSVTKTIKQSYFDELFLFTLMAQRPKKIIELCHKTFTGISQFIFTQKPEEPNLLR